MKEPKTFVLKLFIVLAIVGIALYGGAGILLWYLLKPLTLPAVRVWAVVSTMALPIAIGTGFLLGRREANILTDGLQIGVSQVARAADEVATIKGRAASQLRQPPIQIAVNPQLPEVAHRQIEQPEAVEL